MSDSLRPCEIYSPWSSPGQNTGVGSPSLLQGIILTQGLNPGLPHHRHILYQVRHQGNPRILEWIAYSFSSGSSWPQNWTRFSCIAGGFFTSCAIREAYNYSIRANQRKYLKELRLKFYSYRNKTKAVSPFNHSYISLGQPLWAAGNEYVYRE